MAKHICNPISWLVTITEMEDHELLLSPLDQNIPRIYVVNLLYFPLVHSASPALSPSSSPAYNARLNRSPYCTVPYSQRIRTCRLVGSGAGLLGHAYNLATSIFKSFASFSKKGFQTSCCLQPARMIFLPRLNSRMKSKPKYSSSHAPNLSPSSPSYPHPLPGAVLSPSDGQSPSYISTNDALSQPWLFACVTEARKFIISTDPHQTIRFALTVSGHRLLNPPLPNKYVGNMSLFCHLNLPLQSVTAQSNDVATIAVQIRKRLLQLDDTYIIRN